MALADYFSKNLLAINRLVNTDHSILTDKLNHSLITVAFDENAARTFEGTCGLELLLRLLCRLYPKLKIIDLSGKNEEKVNELMTLGFKINSKIEFVSTEATNEDIYIVAGYTSTKIITKGIIIYYGSDNWLSLYSLSGVKRFGESKNPFGCSMSSGIVAANVFRHLFKEYLKFSELDSNFEFSVFSLNTDTINNNPLLSDVYFDDVVVAGVGAIGNGLLWILSKIEGLKGNLHLVDYETIALSNLQRYILFEEDAVNDIKVEVAKKHFQQKGLKIETTQGKWNNYVKNRNDWVVKCVAVGVDNEKDRIGIQSTLPQVIFNAFTEESTIGITRHRNFIQGACLGCSYIPLKKKKDYLTEVADRCNIPDKINLVKIYYNLNISVDTQIPNSGQESLLHIIAKANKFNVVEFEQYNGKKLEQFYSEFICGGVLLQKSNKDNKNNSVDAPLAFQSALAGILLAGELVKYHIGVDNISKQRTDFYPLSVITNNNPLHLILEKDITKRCICNDKDFIDRYIEKWNLTSPAGAVH